MCRTGRLLFILLTLPGYTCLFVFGKSEFLVRVEGEILGGVLSDQPGQPGHDKHEDPFDKCKHGKLHLLKFVLHAVYMTEKFKKDTKVSLQKSTAV